MREWELNTLGKKTFSLEFDPVADMVNSHIAGQSMISHSTQVSRYRDEKALEDKTVK